MHLNKVHITSFLIVELDEIISAKEKLEGQICLFCCLFLSALDTLFPKQKNLGIQHLVGCLDFAKDAADLAKKFL